MKLHIAKIGTDEFTVWNGNPIDKVDVNVKIIDGTFEVRGKGAEKYKEEIIETTKKYIEFRESEDYIIKVIIAKLYWEFRYYYQASNLKIDYKKIEPHLYKVKMECWLTREKDSYSNEIIVDTSKLNKNVDIYTINIREVEKELYKALKKDTSF